MTRPPLELAVEVRQPNGGTFRWDSAARNAENIPQGLSFKTKRGEGFADANLTLTRRIDRDYVDLHLYDAVNIIGADGSIAYEGRIGGMPRSMGATHSISLQCAGWMSHARDRKFTEIYVDRDLSSWGAVPLQRQLGLLPTLSPVGTQVTSDDTSGPALITSFPGPWSSGARPISEAWYDAGPTTRIGSVYYTVDAITPVSGADANWTWAVLLAADDAAAVVDNTGDLQPAGSSSSGTLTAGGVRRYALVQFYWQTASAAGTNGQEYKVAWRPAVYGSHGATKRGAAPQGVYASDVIEDIVERWCPMLNTAGVQGTAYVIPHLVFREPTDPYDALLEVNKYHLWNLAVWEDRTVHYGPYDLTDYDWEVRLSDPGVEVDLQGDSTENLANGIVVTFQDVTNGRQNRLTPDTHPELRDDSVENPANRAGLQVWTELALSTPTTTDAALQIGRAALAEYNQPKGAGTITVRGHVRDRAGHWHPVWKVRAGDTVAVTDHPNDRPRLVFETDYNHGDGNSPPALKIAVDSTFKRLDALFDRLQTAMTAANLA